MTTRHRAIVSDQWRAHGWQETHGKKKSIEEQCNAMEQSGEMVKVEVGIDRGWGLLSILN